MATKTIWGALTEYELRTKLFFYPIHTNRRLNLDDEGLAGALVHESKVSRSSWRGLLESLLGDRHAQLGHPIENNAPDLGLGQLVKLGIFRA